MNDRRRDRDPQNKEPKPSEVGVSHSGTRRAASGARSPLVIFAEDSAVQSLKLQELLEDAGYRAIGTSNGRGAIEAATEYRPDLIILDLDMPEMNGVETCRHLKEMRSLAGIPVVVLTAHDDPKHLVAAFAAGCKGFLVKGSPDAKLLEKIAKYIPQREARPAGTG